jgi:uncharacterized protein
VYVYLHGFASGSGSSKARLFREKLRQELLVPELDGGDFEHLTITGQLERVEQLIGDREVTIIGSSMGGYLAALYAGRHAAVQRLVLLAPAFGFSERWPETLGAAEVQRWRETGYRDVYHYAQGRQARLHYALLEDAARYPAYPDFQQPALILHGRRDTVVPLEYSEHFAATHPNVQVQVLDTGHEMTDCLPQIWEASRKFLKL